MEKRKCAGQTTPAGTNKAAANPNFFHAHLFVTGILMRALFTSLLMILSVGTALALPRAVELDRLMLHAKAALNAKSYKEAADHLSQAKKLGLALPERFTLDYATALAGLGRTDDATRIVDEYFSKYGTKGASYKEVLELLVRMENQGHGKSMAAIQPASAPGAGNNQVGANQERSMASGADVMKQNVPARPQLPFAVSEDIWQAIETSDAYRNSPRPRPYKVSYQATEQMEYTGAKNSSLPSSAATQKSVVVDANSLSDKCLVTKGISYLSFTRKNHETSSYVCGGDLYLGGASDGKANGFIKSLDELKGSLFPLRIGNQISFRYQLAYMPDRRFDSTTALSCQVISQGSANELNARLKGVAWKIRCQNSNTSNYNGKSSISEIDDYYLEDLGLRLSAIGQFNSLEKRFVLPQPGDKSVLVTAGDYGSRTTTTYTSYEWSVDTEDGEKGKSRPSLQPASTVGASANWGLSDQDLSIMVATDIMKKARVAERRAEILAAAQAGDMISQYLIGSSYAYGVGVDKDSVQMTPWLVKAADQGLARAYAALGIARVSGNGMPQDDITGWTWIMKSSNAGNATGQYLAAILTLSGLDVGGGMTRQYKFLSRPDALVLLNRSAEAGMPAAQYALGHSYMVGTEENPKDLKKARIWLEKAAAQHLPQAVTALASMRNL